MATVGVCVSGNTAVLSSRHTTPRWRCSCRSLLLRWGFPIRPNLSLKRADWAKVRGARRLVAVVVPSPHYVDIVGAWWIFICLWFYSRPERKGVDTGCSRRDRRETLIGPQYDVPREERREEEPTGVSGRCPNMLGTPRNKYYRSATLMSQSIVARRAWCSRSTCFLFQLTTTTNHLGPTLITLSQLHKCGAQKNHSTFNSIVKRIDH